MPKSVDEIRVGANGTIRVAPPDTAVPADIEATFDAAWTDLGYTSEDGVTITDAKTVEAIPVWQLFYPARRIVTERDLTAAFVLRQFSGPQFELAFNASVEQDGDNFSATPNDPETIDERRFAVEWQDGVFVSRFIVHRTFVTENVETKLVRSAAADLPITLGVIGEDGVEPWVFQTNDPSFASAT